MQHRPLGYRRPHIFEDMYPKPNTHVRTRHIHISNTTLQLGECLQEKESIQHEFKEFCLKLNINDYYNRHEMLNMVNTGVLENDFNKIIDTNLQIYFKHYIPKYASAFSNCEISEGVLSIGINDFGEVTGIPYIGELPISLVEKCLSSTLRYIRGNPNTKKCKNAYIQQLKLRILPLDISNAPSRLYDVSEALMKDLESQKHLFESKNRQYLISREKWFNKLQRYSCTLSKMIEYNKKDIYKYIHEKTPQRAKRLIRELDNLEKVNNINPECDWKDNPDNLLFWLFQFKDDAIDKFIEIKPKPPVMPKIFNAPSTLLSQLSDMRLKFVQNTPSIRYYIIQVVFPGSSGNGYHLEYYHPLKCIWNTRVRTWNNICGPCCI